MLPAQLTPESFAAYPREAKAVATQHIQRLRQLPLAFVPLLLRELNVYDYKFPMERRDLDRQLKYLASLSDDQFRAALAPFTGLKLSADLEKLDWINNPAVFTEQLTAHLWTTHQIDTFRNGAIEYVNKANAAFPDEPLPARRLGIAIIGQGAKSNDYRLFRKLRREGTYFTAVRPGGALEAIVNVVGKRAEAHPAPYSHWYIDGGVSATGTGASVARVSYAALSPVRTALQGRMQKIYEASVFDPEAFRTTLAQIKPADIGLDTERDPALSRYELSLLSEGSGTQVFSTTFVQWAVREALRRAQPLTLLARFAPRQREKQMNELLVESRHKAEQDPQGSLVDADMGAYYHWLNQQRLPGAEQSSFLVWFEDHGEAVAIGPGLERGQVSDVFTTMADLLARLT
jgi:hypothetical protein